MPDEAEELTSPGTPAAKKASGEFTATVEASGEFVSPHAELAELRARVEALEKTMTIIRQALGRRLTLAVEERGPLPHDPRSE